MEEGKVNAEDQVGYFSCLVDGVCLFFLFVECSLGRVIIIFLGKTLTSTEPPKIE